MAKKREAVTLDVTYGSVSFGEDTAAVGVSVSRGQFKALAEADALLVKAQLQAEFTGSSPLFDAPIKAEVNSGTMKVDTETLGVRLTFAISTIDRGELSALAKSSGTVTLLRIGDAGTADKDGDE